MPNTLQAAWLLHSRPYRECSVIVDCLVEAQGRVAMVVKGARQRRSKIAPVLQPFRRMLLSWRGRGELKNLTAIEPAAPYYRLTGRPLFCGFYLNELVLSALLPGQAITGLSTLYQTVLQQLANDIPLEPVLRCFELELLALVGYAPALDRDALTGQPLQSDTVYRFQPESGLLPVAKSATVLAHREGYHTTVLQALVARDFSNPDFYPYFKRITRQALTVLLGDRPLKSRALFSSASASKPASIS